MILVLILVSTTHIGIVSTYHQSNVIACAGSTVTCQQSSTFPTITDFNLVRDFPSFFALELPYYSQETGESGGVAALRMAFAHYGWSIDESELIRVARTSYRWWNTGTNGWDLLRAAHFSNISYSFHDPTLQGYSNKWFAVDSVAGVITEAYTSENRTHVLDLIKKLLLEDKVTIFTMWYAGDQDFARQFRVLVGYDDRTDELIFADPWDNPSWKTSYDNFFEYWWLNGGQPGYWVQGLFPWEIELCAVENPELGTISVEARISTGVPEWWRTWPDFEDWKEVSEAGRCHVDSTYIDIQVPNGYTIAQGDPFSSFDFNTSGHATVEWELLAPPIINEDDRIHVSIQGQMHGQSPTYEAYTDTIYHEDELSLFDASIPELGYLNVVTMNEKGIQLEIDIDDQSQISSAELLWRTDVGNWSKCGLELSTNNNWRTITEIPLPAENLTQFQVVVEDFYNNIVTSVVYECNWTHAEYIPSSPTSSITTSTPIDTSIEVGILLIIGTSVPIASILYFRRSKYRRSNLS